MSDHVHWTLYSNTLADYYVAGSNVRYHYIIQFLFCNLSAVWLGVYRERVNVVHWLSRGKTRRKKGLY